MKKKYILLFVLCFLLSGCTYNYELEIYNDTWKEKITINSLDTGINTSPSEYMASKLLEIDGSLSLLNRKVKDIDNSSLESTFSGKLDSYETDVSDILSCYDLYKVNEYDDVITILTSDKFNCFEYYPELEQVTVMIKSNHKLIETNADRVDGYRYYWTIDKVTSDNEKILLKLDSNKKIFNYEGEFVKKVILICGFAVIIIGSATISYKRLKKRNARINQI